MWDQLQRYKALDSGARKIFHRAIVVLPLISASLRFSGFKKTQESLQRRLAGWAPAPANPAEITGRVEMICRMVRAATHYGKPGATCLEQSLALWYLLGRQGISSKLRIGVRKHEQQFEAHAWVEYAGTPLNQAEEAHHHYSAFEDEFSTSLTEKP
jgi:Transglutaminase-like superfamily